jgi:hypothetical protein
MERRSTPVHDCRPMATAPTDGTPVMLFLRSHFGVFRHGPCRFTDGKRVHSRTDIPLAREPVGWGPLDA